MRAHYACTMRTLIINANAVCVAYVAIIVFLLFATQDD